MVYEVLSMTVGSRRYDWCRVHGNVADELEILSGTDETQWPRDLLSVNRCIIL